MQTNYKLKLSQLIQWAWQNDIENKTFFSEDDKYRVTFGIHGRFDDSPNR